MLHPLHRGHGHILLADRAGAAAAEPVVDAGDVEGVQARQSSALVPALQPSQANGAAAAIGASCGRIVLVVTGGVGGGRGTRGLAKAERCGLDGELRQPTIGVAASDVSQHVEICGFC